MPTDLIRPQLSRRSVRRFANRDVTDDELSTLVAAAQAAPTSPRTTKPSPPTTAGTGRPEPGPAGSCPGSAVRSRWPDGTRCGRRWNTSAWRHGEQVPASWWPPPPGGLLTAVPVSGGGALPFRRVPG
ncbi:nitroreductase family protein [Jidongwangia harbinensis]|uniref:nitroreductase family protein n=1 Tax=Jidongwangia harbinensis TaxID=2878561 RepID=UPI001CD91B0A|nr:nitroreductase family protein [Jidongwangia harbinensis]